MKTKKEINRLKRLKTLRQMHDGDLIICNSLDIQIKNLSKCTEQ